MHDNGNLAVFDGPKLRAIAYWQPSPENPLTSGDNGVEDSLGSAEQIDGHRIRLSFGLPSAPFADVVLNDDIFVEHTAKEDRVCGGVAVVPNVFGQDIRVARKKLNAFGWLPRRPPAQEGMTGGEDLVVQGVIEVESCSGTGYAFCAYNYEQKNGLGLRVISAGEEYGVTGYEARCGGSAQAGTDR